MFQGWIVYSKDFHKLDNLIANGGIYESKQYRGILAKISKPKVYLQGLSPDMALDSLFF